MRLLNRAAQRYLLRRAPRNPLVGYPGPNIGEETDWLLTEVGGLVAIHPAADPGLYLRPQSGRVTLEPSSTPADGARWELQAAGDEFQYIVDAKDEEMVLAVELSDEEDLVPITQRKRDRSAAWLMQRECVDDARSVHLRYEAPVGMSLFYNEVTVEQAPPGTFFCIAGFGAAAGAVAPSGYAGIQRRPDGSRIAIFSVWHRMADAVAAVGGAEAIVLGAAPQGETTVFSGEGSGCSIRVPFEWSERHSPIRFAITAERLGSDTAIAAYVAQGSAPWLHLGVILRSATGGALLSHPYAFIEDFARTGNTPGLVGAARSPNQMRSADFRNPWFAVPQEGRTPVRRVRLTAFSPHPLESILANRSSGSDFGISLATGTGEARMPPPVGSLFSDGGPTRTAPDVTAIPHD